MNAEPLCRQLRVSAALVFPARVSAAPVFPARDVHQLQTGQQLPIPLSAIASVSYRLNHTQRP